MMLRLRYMYNASCSMLPTIHVQASLSYYKLNRPSWLGKAEPGGWVDLDSFKIFMYMYMVFCVK